MQRYHEQEAMSLHWWMMAAVAAAAAARAHLGSPEVLRGQVETGTPVTRERTEGHLEGTAGVLGPGGSPEQRAVGVGTAD